MASRRANVLAAFALACAATAGGAWSPAWPTVAGPLQRGTSVASAGPGAAPMTASRLPFVQLGPAGASLVGGSAEAPTLFYVASPYSRTPGALIVRALSPWSAAGGGDGANFSSVLSVGPVNVTLSVLARAPPSSAAADAFISFVSGPANWTLSALDGSSGAPLWSVTAVLAGGEPGAALSVTPDGSRVLLLTTGGVSGGAPLLRTYDAATGAAGTPLGPGALPFGGDACWALVPTADGSAVFAASATAVTRWDLGATDPSAAVAWSAPHGLPPSSPPVAAASMFEVAIAGAPAVVVVGALNVSALAASSGALLWSFTPGDTITAVMAAPASAGSAGDALLVLHSAGFWASDFLTAVSADTGAMIGASVLHSGCHSVTASAAYQWGSGLYLAYTLAVCWTPPTLVPAPAAAPGAGNRTARNGYPIYVIVDSLNATAGTLTRAGSAFLSGGDYAGALADTLPVGPGPIAWWAFTGSTPLLIKAQ